LFDKGIISKSDWDKAIVSFEVQLQNNQLIQRSKRLTTVNSEDNLGRTTCALADGTISMLNVGERVLGLTMTGTERPT
jgi:HlyD family secretion protein